MQADLPDGTGIDPNATGVGIGPQTRVSAPEYVDWHMILDQELDQLTGAQTGVLGAIGFMTLGAVFGVAPAFVKAVGKSPDHLVGEDVTAVVVFTACFVASAICLTLFWLSLRKKKDLPATIRARKKHGVTDLISR